MDKQEDFLWNLFRNVNAWLEFAERKNTHLSSFLGLGFLLAAALKEGILPISKLKGTIPFCAALIFLGGAWLTSMSSFFPRVIPNYLRLWRSSAAVENPNLLFYGDIATMTPQVYADMLKQEYTLDKVPKKALLDFSLQLVQNSQIAQRKFRLFQWGLGQMCVGLAGLITALVKYA